MPATARGITYPDDAGHTRLWDHLQTVAETTDAALDDLGVPVERQKGAANMPASGSTYASVVVTFPVPFSATPDLVLVTSTNVSVVLGISGVSATGFTISGRRVDLANMTSAVNGIPWVAELG